uniref:Uncharacterized protein n=1 Tax=Aegilops tauschii subsp. strangulata TaxID=200361 RepID=A0A453I7W2_AEGTS
MWHCWVLQGQEKVLQGQEDPNNAARRGGNEGGGWWVEEKLNQDNTIFLLWANQRRRCSPWPESSRSELSMCVQLLLPARLGCLAVGPVYLKYQCPRPPSGWRQPRRHEVQRGPRRRPATYARERRCGGGDAEPQLQGAVCMGDFRAAWSGNPVEVWGGRGRD